MKIVEIFALVADAFAVSTDDMRAAPTFRDAVAARDAFGELARRYTRRSFNTIAHAVDIDGQVIRNGHYRRFPRRMAEDPAFAHRFAALDAEIKRIVAAEREGHSIRSRFFNQKRLIEKDYSHGA